LKKWGIGPGGKSKALRDCNYSYGRPAKSSACDQSASSSEAEKTDRRRTPSKTNPSPTEEKAAPDISNQVLEADLTCPTQEQMKNLNRDSFAEMQTSSSDIAAAEADDQASEEDAKPEPMKLTGLGDLNLLGPVVEQV
jgi:hypothetical protein